MLNHRKHELRSALFLFSFVLAHLGLTACVSVQLPLGPVPKAEKAKAKAPQLPFEVFVSQNADESWISSKTGNTISYLSECKKTNEKIEEVALELSQVIESSKVVKSNRGLVSSKPSSDLIVTGKVDSHKVKMAISVFKTDDCLFSLTYGGLDDKFEQEIKFFEEFKAGFQTP